MNSFVVSIVIGIVVIVIGILNMKENLSTLHWYHHNNIQEEDRIPYGKKVGLGTIIIGGTVILSACAEFASAKMNTQALKPLSTVILIIGLVIGFVLIFRAMLKYNKGIF